MPANPLTKQRQAEIATIVENILLSVRKFYPNDSLIQIIESTIPDVHITETTFDGQTNIRGAIFRKSKEYERPTIAINSAQTNGGKNFAIAHEFGHFMLGHGGDANFYIDDKPFDGSETMQNEGEANFFASVLLMPKEAFLKLDLPFISDEQLAEHFGVSVSAIGVRREWIHRNGF